MNVPKIQIRFIEAYVILSLFLYKFPVNYICDISLMYILSLQAIQHETSENRIVTLKVI